MTKNTPQRRVAIEAIKNACNGQVPLEMLDIAGFPHKLMRNPLQLQQKFLTGQAHIPNRRFGTLIKQESKHINITGIILAGGKSSRMGTSKPFVKFHGVPMLERMIQTIATVCNEVIVIASQGQRLPKIDVPVHRDRVPHQGPLGGMLVGLEKAKNDICFVTSCDMPLLKPEIITFMSRLLTKRLDCIVPEADGYLHPLCAVYKRDNVLQRLIVKFKNGERAVYRLVKSLRAKVIYPTQWVRVDPKGASFKNMNTPYQLRDLGEGM